MDLQEIQKYLSESGLDGWLMSDFHGRNEIAISFLGISGMLTRRSFYFIRPEGEPIALVNVIEKAKFQHLPGELIAYSGYTVLESELKKMLSGSARIAMEYSPGGRLPYIGLVDAGTIEMVREMGCEIVSSADMVANFGARLTPEQIATHRVAAHNVIEIKDAAHQFIAKALSDKTKISEYDVCQFILAKFEEFEMDTEHFPIVGVNAHAGDPHYEPEKDNSTTIEKGQLILIDLWAKIKSDDGIFADITWMAYAGTKDEIPAKYSEIFDVIIRARDAAIAFVRENIDKRPVFGAEVDDVCRQVVIDAGYGEYFTHRTGHSIATSIHGPGPNIDNLETEDKRQLQRGHLFSIEPGIYMDEIGFRTEIDALITHEGCEVTTLPLQTGIVPLF